MNKAIYVEEFDLDDWEELFKSENQIENLYE